MSNLGEWPAVCVINDVLWPDFHCFFFDAWSQIYTLPLIPSSRARLRLGSTTSNLRLGAIGDGTWPARAAVSGESSFCSTTGGLFLSFFLCIPLVSPVQSVYVLLKFY
jgi:hypothetical protein